MSMTLDELKAAIKDMAPDLLKEAAGVKPCAPCEEKASNGHVESLKIDTGMVEFEIPGLQGEPPTVLRLAIYDAARAFEGIHAEVAAENAALMEENETIRLKNEETEDTKQHAPYKPLITHWQMLERIILWVEERTGVHLSLGSAEDLYHKAGEIVLKKSLAYRKRFHETQTSLLSSGSRRSG